MKMIKIALITMLSTSIFVACDNQQEVVPQTSALATADSTILESSNNKANINGKLFDEVHIQFFFNDNIAGNAEQTKTFGEFETRIERFVRFNSAGAYSFRSAVERFLRVRQVDTNFRTESYFYRLGFRVDGSVPEGGGNPAFALPTTTPDPDVAPSPDKDVVSDTQLAQAGLKRLYAFISDNRRDFVFSAGQEAESLLAAGSGYTNVSRGHGSDSQGVVRFIADAIDTPNSTDLLVFINGNEPNTAPLFRYRNPSLGTHVHLVGFNNPEAQAFIDAGFMKEEPELGYVYVQ